MWYPQRQANTCGVAALRTVLSEQLGVEVSESVLVAFGTYPAWPIREQGTTSGQLRRILREADRAFHVGVPWRMRYRRRGRLAELKRWTQAGVLPLARVLVDGILHMIVVTQVSPTVVSYFDPADGRHHQRTRRRFLAWWRDTDGSTWYAVVLP